MKISDLLEGAKKVGTTLGGFPVKVLHIQDSGQPEQEVAESSQRVDRLVTRALEIMSGGKPADAIAALKTVLGEMEYNERPQFYAFYIRQMLDMYGKKGVAESSGDTVDFEVDSENAYNKVMKKFGSVIDRNGDAMVAPRKYWGDIQELVYLAGGEATEVGDEHIAEGELDKFKKYIRPVVTTTPKIERTTNPAGRTTDHVEWKVTTPTGEIYRYKSKKQAQEHFDSFGHQGVAEGKGKATCGCGSECKHCSGKHSLKEVDKKCSCCGNMIKLSMAEATALPASTWEVAEGEEHLSRIRKLSGLDEALKIDAPQKAWSKQDMQDYATRIKTGTKTKQDRFKPIIHGSNIKAITKDDGGEEWDLNDLAKQIKTRPRSILGTNAKMAKSKKEGAITYDLTLPALSGIVVDEETGEFVEIITCPGAGECQLICYARKGGYVMFPASSMSAAQALNFLVNHPKDYMNMFDAEVKKAKALADKNGIKLLVRIHDAGDFFSKEYYNLSMDVARNNPNVKFYFYTKMGEIATDASAPPNVVSQFSSGSKSREVKTVNVVRNAGNHVKDAVTLPKDMFRGLFVTDEKGKYVKDEQGRTQVKSPEAWDEFKQTLASKYKIDPNSIITYDQMNRIPEGPKPKWNVVVFPAGHGDLGATRLDVQNQFLMFH